MFNVWNIVLLRAPLKVLMLLASALDAAGYLRPPVATPSVCRHAGGCLPLPWFMTTGETMTQNHVDLSALNQGSTGGNQFSQHQHTKRQLGQVIQTE